MQIYATVCGKFRPSVVGCRRFLWASSSSSSALPSPPRPSSIPPTAPPTQVGKRRRRRRATAASPPCFFPRRGRRRCCCRRRRGKGEGGSHAKVEDWSWRRGGGKGRIEKVKEQPITGGGALLSSTSLVCAAGGEKNKRGHKWTATDWNWTVETARRPLAIHEVATASCRINGGDADTTKNDLLSRFHFLPSRVSSRVRREG